jgi:hypothetical protein
MPQVRFTVRQMMIIPVFVAIATSAWLTVDRLRWGRYRASLDREMKWSRNSAGEFLLPLKESRSPTGHLAVKPEPKGHRPICVLKISSLVGPDREGHYYERRWSLGEGGEWFGQASTPLGRKGSQHNLGPHKLAEVRRILSTLPPSDRTASPAGGSVLVSFYQGSKWSTRIYDKTSPPSQVQCLLQALRILLR